MFICSSRFKFRDHTRRHSWRGRSDQRIVLLRVHGVKIGRPLLKLWWGRGAVQHETARRCVDAAIRKRLRDSNLAAAAAILLVFINAGVSVDHVFKAVDQNERFGAEFVFGHGNENKQENENKLNYAKVAIL